MLTIILTSPPHLLQVSISISNTRFNRCAQVMAARHSAGVWFSSSDRGFLTLPRLAGVTCARCLLFGAKTPWNRVRLTLDLGTKATRISPRGVAYNRFRNIRDQRYIPASCQVHRYRWAAPCPNTAVVPPGPGKLCTWPPGPVRSMHASGVRISRIRAALITHIFMVAHWWN